MKSVVRSSVIAVGVASAALIFGAAGGEGCGGPIGPTPCSPDTEATDCGAEGDERCHPTDLVCVPNCVIQGADVCGADAPLCNDPDNRPVDDEDFNNICVCGADDDCGEGEICNAESHKCEEGVGGPCEIDDDCPDPDSEVCVEGECILFECAEDDTCFDAEELCNEPTSQCEDPDLVEGNCPGANSFPTAREAGGSLLFDVEFEADAGFDCGLIGLNGDGYSVFAFFVDFEDDMPADGAEDGNSFTWAEDASAVQNASDFPIWGSDAGLGYRTLFANICFVTPPDSIAVQLVDNSNNASNVGCADLQ